MCWTSTNLPARKRTIAGLLLDSWRRLQAGDKSSVQLKPKVFDRKGFLLVSTNYRLLPHVPIEELIHDVAKSIGWVHAHIAEQGGDPNRIVVGGHSAGAQLAALMCTDERYLQQERVSFKSLRGCIPVDGDTYDIPKIIMTAELRQALYGGEMPTFGHRQKFGNDPQKHVDLSAVTHVHPERISRPSCCSIFRATLTHEHKPSD